MSQNSLTQNKPKKSSLISNLLNRVDGKSLAMKKAKTSGVVYYLESENQKHLKVNKAALLLLNYDELEILITGQELHRSDFTMAMFKLEEHVAPKKVEPKPSFYVTNGIKEVDKQGSSKFADNSTDKKQAPGTKKKFTHKR